MSKFCFKFFFITSHSQYYSCNWEWNQPNIYFFAKSNKLQSLFLAFEQVDGYSNFKRVNHSKFSPIHWIQIYKNHLYQDPRAGKSVESQALCFEKFFKWQKFVCFLLINFYTFWQKLLPKRTIFTLDWKFPVLSQVTRKKNIFSGLPKGF